MSRSFHPLRVKPIKNEASDVNSTIEATTSKEEATSMSPTDYQDPDSAMITHDFSPCCRSYNVSEACSGFCVLHNILDGTTGNEPEMCEKDFPNIVKCMADGRNHVPCCEGKGIPDLCQDMCRGEYTPFTDYLKSRVSCVAHTLPGLQCILEGIQKLPSEPQSISVEPLTEKSLQVFWSPPEKLAETVKFYQVNATKLHSFDQDQLANLSTTEAVSVKVPADTNNVIMSELEPFTMYAITVTAINDFGSSLPSFRVRALTLENGVVNKQTSVAVVPILPGKNFKFLFRHFQRKLIFSY